MSLLSVATPSLDDEDLERMRRAHAAAIAEMQRQPASQLRVIADVRLEDGIATSIPHGAGRAVMVFVSPSRNAVSSGRIDEIRDGADRTRFVVLKASGFGATITVDLAVM